METYRDYPLIDVEDGLKRTMNNKKLYVKFLNSFITKPMDETLFTALETKNLEESLAAAHTIKGVAANLSLLRLRYYAAEIEARMKKDGHDSDVFSSMEKEMARDCINETVDKVKEVIEKISAEL